MNTTKKFGGYACCRKGDSLPTLYYFDTPGRAEAARFCFLLGGVEFKDIRFPKDSTWLSYWKQRSPTGKAPWLEVDGTKLPESRAIVMYAARKSNLVPLSQEHMLHCEMLLDMINNMMEEGAAYAMKSGMADKYAAFAVFLKEYISQGRLLALERAVVKYQSEEGYIVGGMISYADAYVSTLLASVGALMPKESLAEFRAHHPGLHKVKDVIYNMDVIKNYLMKYPSSVVLDGSVETCEKKIVILALEAANINYTIAPVAEGTTQQQQSARVLILNQSQRIEGLEAILEWINNRYSLLPLDTKRVTVVWELVQSVRDICVKYDSWDEQQTEAVATRIDGVDSRLRDLHTTEGGSISLTIADFAAAVLYELLSLDNKAMKFDSSLETLAESYSRVYLIKSVRLGILKRTKPALYYFNMRAKAESCRMMFHIAGIPFEDVRFSFEEFQTTYKAQSPTGQVPFVKIGKDLFPESLAITKMIGEVTGFAPCTAHGKMVADCVAAAYDRCMVVSNRAYLLPKEKQSEFRKEHVVPCFDVWEKVLSQFKCKGDWIVENRLTWIDVFVAAEYRMWNVYYQSIEMDAERWPALTSIHKKVMELPAIGAYEMTWTE